MIGNNPINLLGHQMGKTSHIGFDIGNGDLQFRRLQSLRQERSSYLHTRLQDRVIPSSTQTQLATGSLPSAVPVCQILPQGCSPVLVS